METSTFPKSEDAAKAMPNHEIMVNQTPKQQQSRVMMGVYMPKYNVMDAIVLVIIAEIFQLNKEETGLGCYNLALVSHNKEVVTDKSYHHHGFS